MSGKSFSGRTAPLSPGTVSGYVTRDGEPIATVSFPNGDRATVIGRIGEPLIDVIERCRAEYTEGVAL